MDAVWLTTCIRQRGADRRWRWTCGVLEPDPASKYEYVTFKHSGASNTSAHFTWFWAIWFSGDIDTFLTSNVYSSFDFTIVEICGIKEKNVACFTVKQATLISCMPHVCPRCTVFMCVPHTNKMCTAVFSVDDRRQWERGFPLTAAAQTPWSRSATVCLFAARAQPLQKIMPFNSTGQKNLKLVHVGEGRWETSSVLSCGSYSPWSLIDLWNDRVYRGTLKGSVCDRVRAHRVRVSPCDRTAGIFTASERACWWL